MDKLWPLETVPAAIQCNSFILAIVSQMQFCQIVTVVTNSFQVIISFASLLCPPLICNCFHLYLLVMHAFVHCLELDKRSFDILANIPLMIRWCSLVTLIFLAFAGSRHLEQIALYQRISLAGGISFILTVTLWLVPSIADHLNKQHRFSILDNLKLQTCLQ